ncbi:MAG: GTP-binding protein, partial [Gallionellaceae bacterium]|nr:GTP-binding protein [Gallionellaceae bacterium]
MSRALRNIAIIAHVDHGKTTLVDQLLRQSGTFRDNQKVDARVMDNNDLEKERGITILAKNTAIDYEGTHINIVDTPGHADFGGEVERVLGMVNGVLLLVDAVEGPMPQTRFVTKKALALGLKPIVVINKIDRPGARADWVLDQTFDLFDKLGATDEQLDFPVIYASGLNGWACLELKDAPSSGGSADNMRPLFETVLKFVPTPPGDPEAPLQLQLAALDYSTFTGRLGIGRVLNGRIKPGQQVVVMNHSDQVSSGRINQVLGFRGLDRVPVDEAEAGDIIIISGLDEIGIGVTICDKDAPVGLPVLGVDEPTLTMDFMVNGSPLAGTEGKFVSSRQIRDRLTKELLT